MSISFSLADGDGECSTTVASLGGSVAQADWFCPKVTQRCSTFVRWTGRTRDHNASAM